MCVIIHKPKGIIIPKDILRSCWQANPNGAGIMYFDNGELVIGKGFMRLKTFLEEYESIKPEDKEIVIHFRFATHGEISPEQTHPFIVKNKYGVMHNGIISFDQQERYDWSDIKEESLEEFEDNYVEVEAEKEGTDSDTLRFCKEVLEELPDNFTKQAGIVTLLDLFLAGENSVLVIMDNEGNVTKHGCDDGKEIGGCWYSNTHWQKKFIPTFQTIGENYEQENH